LETEKRRATLPMVGKKRRFLLTLLLHAGESDEGLEGVGGCVAIGGQKTLEFKRGG